MKNDCHTIISRLLIAIVIALFSTQVKSGIVERVMPENFSHDERLRYTVTYLGIRIGAIEMLNRYDDNESKSINETVITLRTFSGIPFLSVHTEFYSRRGSDGFFIESTTFDRERNKWAYYHASRKDKTKDIIVDRGYQDRGNGEVFDVEVDTLHPGKHVHDALTFISILRDLADTGNTYELDVLIDRSVELIRVNSPKKKEIIDVRAFDNETEAYHITGVIDFTAIHGLTREYQSWISTGRNRIPLKARVRIGIGSVKIELEEYEYIE